MNTTDNDMDHLSSDSNSGVIGYDPQFQSTFERHDIFRSQAQICEQLATILFEFYYCEGPAFVLGAVGELFRVHLSLVAICDTSKISLAIAHVGDWFFAEFELNHDLKALDCAIKYYERVIGQLDPESSHLSYLEGRLGYALLCRFKATSSEADCRVAWDILDNAQRRSKDLRVNETSYAWIMTIVTLLKSTSTTWPLFSVTSEDLIETLERLRKGARNRLSPYQYFLSIIAEGNIAVSIFAKTRRVEFLDPVIKTLRSTLHLCSENADVLRYKLLMQLSSLHYNSHQHYSNDVESGAHLDAAVEAASKARSLTSYMERNSYARWYSLHRWAMAALQRDVQYQDLDGMENAVDALREAVFTCPESQKFQMIMANNLAAAMGLYFNQSGRISVLDQLIALRDTFGTEYILRAPFLTSNIAEAMLSRAQIADNKTARILIKQAIHLSQARKDAPGFAKLNNRERVSVDLQLITASRMQIRAGEEPFLSPESMLQLAKRSLVDVLPRETSARIGLVLAQIDALISQARLDPENAAEVLESGHLLIQEEMTTAGMSSSIYAVDLLAARAHLFLAQSDLDKGKREAYINDAWSLYDQAANITSGRARERFQTCLRWAECAVERGRYPIAFKAYQFAVDILPHVVFLGEEVIGRIEALRQVSGLAGSSVATALEISDIAAAIDFLERTRGILWLQSFPARDSRLQSLPVTLRERFISVSRELESADHLHWTTRRHRAEELQRILHDIRQLPRLERFQLPPLLEDIQICLRAKEAYAVVIVPSGAHCDVVILGMGLLGSNSSDHPFHLRLPKLTVKRIRDLSHHFSTACSIDRAAQGSLDVPRKVTKVSLRSVEMAHDSVSDLLSQLWTTLVQPILKRMNMLIAPGRAERKRLWWCPTGALSSLPLHAAGIYEGTNKDDISKYVISSYTPTLTALHRMLTDTSRSEPSPVASRVLLVAQEDSGSLPSLANARIEVDLIKSIIPLACSTSPHDDHGTTVGNVLENLKDAHVLHLACHGHQDQENPLNSGFDLKDGRLSLGQLMRLSMPQAQLAYLSACDSAGMDESRPDEGLNLVGTMIFVGFKSVIGTMWAMNDLDGPFMAKQIYSRIFQSGTLDLGAVPQAVDDAVRQLRESGVPASRWATYVHFGI